MDQKTKKLRDEIEHLRRVLRRLADFRHDSNEEDRERGDAPAEWAPDHRWDEVETIASDAWHRATLTLAETEVAP